MVKLDGEVVRDVKPVIGYLHTGIEKTAEDKSYWKVIPVVERMDYLAYYFNAMAYVGAVETLLDVEVPPRAQYLRVIHLELNRIMSHLVWLGTSMLDLGAISMFWYCFRERETDPRPVRVLLRPAHAHALLPGRRRHRGHPGRLGGQGARVLRGDARRADQYAAILEKNEIVLQRLRDVGRARGERCSSSASPARCCARPATRGTCARPSPTRATTTSTSRSRSAPWATTTTASACATPRSTSSVKIIEQALDGLPEGPYITEDRKVALPPRHELATSMEALIHHFKLVTEGFRVPPGEVYYPIEGPRGELGCFVRSDGSSKPARVHMRDSSFTNLQAFAPWSGTPTSPTSSPTLAMLDPILGGIDR